jgi:ribosome biogenesis GTPase
MPQDRSQKHRPGRRWAPEKGRQAELAPGKARKAELAPEKAGEAELAPENAPRAEPAPSGSSRVRLRGTVTQVLGVQWEVLAGGERLRCLIKKTVVDQQGAPVVGDVVEIDPPSGGMSRIFGIVPRRSALLRPDVHRTQTDQVLVANIDQVVIVAAVAAPPLNPWLVDRYLVAAWKAGTRPLLCLTKCDLPLEPGIDAAIQTFVDIDVPVVRTCALTGEGIDALMAELEGRSSAFVGQSGVGKTSLARALLHDPTLKVGTISEATGKGRHTTSSARLLPLPEGHTGFLIDLPGQRVFGLSGLGAEDLMIGFPDLDALGPCALPLCRHRDEPGCVVLEAVEEGRVPARRLQAYDRIRESLESEG